MQDALAHNRDKIDPHRRDELTVVLSFLDDARRIIEGGKGRRWEVFKWAFALNILILSALMLARDKLYLSPYALLFASGLTSFMAALLIDHYDNRVTNARNRANKLYEWLRSNILDVHDVMGELRPVPPEQKDHPERVFFFFGIAGSFLAIGLAIGVITCHG